MKHLSLIFASLALSVSVVQAKVYDITLTNAMTYTQCQVKYRGSNTKFVGKDKAGKLQTVVVPSSRILNMREVEEEVEEVPAEPAPAPAPQAEQSASEAPEADKSAADTADGADNASAASAEDKPADTPAAAEDGAKSATAEDTTPAATDDGQAQNATLRLRDKLASADAEFAALRSPSKALSRRMSYTRERIVSSLDKLDKQALKVAELQQEFNRAGRGEFAFTIVSEEQRTQYKRDGEAAYKAMVIDMKEKPGARKVGGIDKFEIMRDRYQGIPEYKPAYEWYIKTLHALDKKWTKMLDNEQRRRKSAQPAKKAAMAEADSVELEKLRHAFEADNEDIAAVWFNPRPRNMEMLKLACNKVHDALRRNENTKLDEAVGTVPSLLEQEWEAMDNARRLMMEGQLDQADEVLTKDASYDLLRRLHPNIFPKDYREPVMEQRKALENEIRTRKRNVRSTMTKLEREASMLERSTGSAEAQIDALLEEIRREKNLDAGENTVAMEDSMNEPEGEEDAAEGAVPAAEPAPAAEEPNKG